IYDLLKNKGKLYISSIIRRKYARWIYKYRGEYRLYSGHVREYQSEQQFRELLAGNGFKVTSLKKQRFFFHLFYWIEIFLINFGLIGSKKLRQYYEKFSILEFLRKKAGFFIPGFYVVEAWAEKD
ncbi:hypothetical protein KAR52_03755, partial [Candidatus Pacearchaeota archaeon]|nr:hypothetical protein [Candidatus Pacearchaeota archaeon]